MTQAIAGLPPSIQKRLRRFVGIPINMETVSAIKNILAERSQVPLHDIACDLGIKKQVAQFYLDYLKATKEAHRVSPQAATELGRNTWAPGAGANQRMGQSNDDPIQVTTRNWTRGIAFKASELERCLFPSYGVMA